MIAILNSYWRWIVGILSVCLLVAIATGGYYYTLYTRREAYLSEASYHYSQLTQDGPTENTVTVSSENVTVFSEKYSDTPYVGLLQLQLAQQAVQQNQLAEAFTWLQKAANDAKDPDIRCLARQRGARVLAALGQLQEALQFLSVEVSEAYAASTEEIKGDILHAMGDKKNALQAYQRAKQIAPDLEPARPLLQLKINDLDYLSESASSS